VLTSSKSQFPLRLYSQNLPRVPQCGKPSKDIEQMVIVDEDPGVLAEESQEINGTSRVEAREVEHTFEGSRSLCIQKVRRTHRSKITKSVPKI
jgi:hypothetical protein